MEHNHLFIMIVILGPIVNHIYCTEYMHTSHPLNCQFQIGLAVSYACVADKLNILIKFLRLDHNRFKPLSFRIRAATSTYCLGRSEDIKRMGRWESNADHAISACKLLRLITCTGSC